MSDGNGGSPFGMFTALGVMTLCCAGAVLFIGPLAGGAVMLTALLAGTLIFKKSGAWRNLKFDLSASDEEVIEGQTLEEIR